MNSSNSTRIIRITYFTLLDIFFQDSIKVNQSEFVYNIRPSCQLFDFDRLIRIPKNNYTWLNKSKDEEKFLQTHETYHISWYPNKSSN